MSSWGQELPNKERFLYNTLTSFIKHRIGVGGNVKILKSWVMNFQWAGWKYTWKHKWMGTQLERMWSACFMCLRKESCAIACAVGSGLIGKSWLVVGNWQLAKFNAHKHYTESHALVQAAYSSTVSPPTSPQPSRVHVLLCLLSLLRSLSLIYHQSQPLRCPCQNGSMTSSTAWPALGRLFKAL